MPRLKSWESPRREGRNDKGKGGSKKKKQWLKRQQMLRNKLKNNQNNQQQGGDKFLPFLLRINNKNCIYLTVNFSYVN
jgi:hypothetical protein